jgi:hypothetical protein
MSINNDVFKKYNLDFKSQLEMIQQNINKILTLDHDDGSIISKITKDYYMMSNIQYDGKNIGVAYYIPTSKYIEILNGITDNAISIEIEKEKKIDIYTKLPKSKQKSTKLRSKQDVILAPEPTDYNFWDKGVDDRAKKLISDFIKNELDLVKQICKQHKIHNISKIITQDDVKYFDNLFYQSK